MKIGEFAKVCNTHISVLRHYDKEGLLVPDYIDRFTGYRYYMPEQIAVFTQITALKKAGFSLAEIKDVLSKEKSQEKIIAVIERKQKELCELFDNLEKVKKMMLGEEKMSSIVFYENGSRLMVQGSVRDEMEKEIAEMGYQRISAYSAGESGITCEVVKLKEKGREMNENIDFGFEDDPKVVGRWDIVGEFAVKEDFVEGSCDQTEDLTKEIYFLPDGERYWCYGWTKGLLLVDDGVNTSANAYELEEMDGELYMFVQYKSYAYLHGGKPTVLVLRKRDSGKYTAQGIAKKDDINMPFVNDESVLGAWKAYSFCRTKAEFDPEKPADGSLYFSHLEFLANGGCISRYGEEIIEGEDMQVWTKGFLLRKWNSSACAYEVIEVDGKEYLMIEWKSGDYRWGGFETDYYVFERE